GHAAAAEALQRPVGLETPHHVIVPVEDDEPAARIDRALGDEVERGAACAPAVAVEARLTGAHVVVDALWLGRHGGRRRTALLLHRLCRRREDRLVSFRGPRDEGESRGGGREAHPPRRAARATAP